MNLDRSNWRKHRFGDVVEQKKERDDVREKGTRYIEGGHMNSEDIHLREWGVVDNSYLGPAFHRKFEKGDILYGSRRTYLKKVAVADFDGITANTTFVMRPIEEKIEPRLVPFLMLSDSFTEHSVKNSKGSVNPYINWKDIAKYEFLLPPLAEQKKLADLLWAGDKVLQRYRELDKNLRVLIQRNIKHLREYEGTKCKLGEIINLEYGSPLIGSDRSGDGFPVVGSSGITGYHREFSNKGPGITIGRKGSAGQVIWIEENFWTIDTAFTVINKSKLPLKFIYYLLISCHLEHLIISTAVPGINRDDVLLSKVIIPEISVAEDFVNNIKKIEDSSIILMHCIENQEKVNKTLINQIFG